MKKFIKQLENLEKKEQKIINKKENKIIEERITPIVDKIESKVPEGLKKTLETAFYKAFKLIFEKGTKYIEKSYNKEKIQINHYINDYSLDKKSNKKTLKDLDRHANKSKIINTSISTIEGAGLGLIGMGIPDIPLFTAMVLKTIYEISLNYGFVYELTDEKIYILNLIMASLSKGDEKKFYNMRVDEIGKKIDSHLPLEYKLDKEIVLASNKLSDSMLTSKFIQGIPVVGVVGSITNYTVINKISKYSSIKYKKRYLSKK